MGGGVKFLTDFAIALFKFKTLKYLKKAFYKDFNLCPCHAPRDVPKALCDKILVFIENDM